MRIIFRGIILKEILTILKSIALSPRNAPHHKQRHCLGDYIIYQPIIRNNEIRVVR